jgi:hypothetical protein
MLDYGDSPSFIKEDFEDANKKDLKKQRANAYLSVSTPEANKAKPRRTTVAGIFGKMGFGLTKSKSNGPVQTPDSSEKSDDGKILTLNLKKAKTSIFRKKSDNFTLMNKSVVSSPGKLER